MALPIRERYQAFRYGVERLRPPVILSAPLAQGGEDALNIVISENRILPDDFVLMASLHVYSDAKQAGKVDVCSEKFIVEVVSQENLIHDMDLRAGYRNFLSQICPNL